MLFSLDSLMTNNQMLSNIFCFNFISKSLASSLFELKQQPKKSMADIWYVFSIWILVTGLPNEKNIWEKKAVHEVRSA